MVTNEDILILSGKLANVTRTLVGGKDLTSGMKIPAANLSNLSEIIEQVRIAIDKYDEAILKQTYERNR